jgi:glycosyltransferase involved in cell wall biosynthesis
MVDNGRTGLIVPKGDYEQLAASALRLFDEPGLAQSLIQQGREECRKYRWESVRDAWVKVYSELASGSSKGLESVKVRATG